MHILIIAKFTYLSQYRRPHSRIHQLPRTLALQMDQNSTIDQSSGAHVAASTTLLCKNKTKSYVYISKFSFLFTCFILLYLIIGLDNQPNHCIGVLACHDIRVELLHFATKSGLELENRAPKLYPKDFIRGFLSLSTFVVAAATTDIQFSCCWWLKTSQRKRRWPNNTGNRKHHQWNSHIYLLFFALKINTRFIWIWNIRIEYV